MHYTENSFSNSDSKLKLIKKLKIVNTDKPNNSLQKIKILLGQQTKILAEKVSFDNSI